MADTVPEMIVGSIQWGGGTPSQLGTVNIAEVAKRLAARFDRRRGSETSMEVDPRFCDEALVATMRDIGVDRAQPWRPGLRPRRAAGDQPSAIGR